MDCATRKPVSTASGLEARRSVAPRCAVWDRAAEMIMLAGTTKEAADVQEATRQILVALGHENWWKVGR